MAENENPTVVARETLKLLATRRMAPTPLNYQKIYFEIAGRPVQEPGAGDRFATVVRQLAAREAADTGLGALARALDDEDSDAIATALRALGTRPSKSPGPELGPVFRDALRQLDMPHRGWTMGRKRDGLDRLLAAGGSDVALAAKLQKLVRSWQESPSAVPAETEAPVPSARPAERPAAGTAATFDPVLAGVRELLAATLENGVGPRLERYTDVYSELFQLAWKVREAEVGEDWSRLALQLKQFWLKVELRVEPDEELIEHLMRLLGLVVENVDELVEDDQWVQGQVAVLRELISKPVDLKAVREAERGFKEVIFKQSQLKASLAEAKASLKSLLSVFIERLAEVTGTTVDYHAKIERYAQRIAATDTIDSLRGAYNAVFPILNNPAGTARLFNSADPAAVADLKARFPLLRPVYNANADMLDQASRGYEARLTANPLPGLRLRATFSKTERERENLFKFTRPMAAELGAYIRDLQTKNPAVNVGNLATAANPAVTVNSLLDYLDRELDDAIDSLGNNFGGGKMNANLTTTYDFQKFLRGFGTTLSTRYRSGAYTGAYEVRTGGVASGTLLETVPRFGRSTLDFDLNLRYRTRVPWVKNARATVQLNIANLLDESGPIIRRSRAAVVAPGATPPLLDPSSYFIRLPRSWTLTTKFDF